MARVGRGRLDGETLRRSSPDTIPHAAANMSRTAVAGPGEVDEPVSPLTRTESVEIELDGLELSYRVRGETYVAVRGLSLAVDRGEFVAVVGPSGCGKSSILGCVAGLLRPTAGTARHRGSLIAGPDSARATVFQSPSLLPWRTVRGNISFGLEASRPRIARKEIGARVDWAVQLVGLERFSRAYPHQLSGGMQQRVNLARALVVRPSVLLLDEPFAAVDALTRERLQGELEHIWMETRTTAIFVTHDVAEAVTLADRVVVLSASPGSVRKVVAIDEARPRLGAGNRGAQNVQAVRDIRECLWDTEE